MKQSKAHPIIWGFVEQLFGSPKIYTKLRRSYTTDELYDAISTAGEWMGRPHVKNPRAYFLSVLASRYRPMGKLLPEHLQREVNVVQKQLVEHTRQKKPQLTLF